jgi:acetolactate synthase-1/2/3 large subunit
MLPKNVGITLGISLDVISALNSIVFKDDQSRFYVTQHCGQLGWDLPATIGVLDSGKHDLVICITGDGSLMFNLQELATINKVGKRVIVFVYDNLGYNSIRTTQAAHLKGAYNGSTIDDLKFPEWEGLAKSFGFQFLEISENSQINEKLIALLSAKESYFVRISIHPDRSRTPRMVSKLSDGKFITPKLTDQYPTLEQGLIEELNDLTADLMSE